MSDPPSIPPPAHWRRSFVRPKHGVEKINFDLLFDAMNPIKVPKASKSSSSDETIDLPREFPPPGHIWYPPFQVPPPPPPPPPPAFLVQGNPRKTSPRPPLSSSSSGSSSDSKCPWPVPFPNSRNTMLESTSSKCRVDLDGHTYSSDHKNRRDPERPRAANYDATSVPYCARCGRPRSKRYQLANPIEQGAVLVPSICSRCIPPVPAKSAAEKETPPRRNEREVEEILIRRGRRNPDPVMRIFQPRSAEIVRVVRRSRSSSPRQPKQRARKNQRSSSSDDVDKNQTRQQPTPRIPRYEPGSPSEGVLYPSRDLKIRVRSRSGTLRDDDDPPLKVAKRDYRCADQLIAAHPNAWGHVRLVSVDGPNQNPSAARDSKAQDEHAPPPTEWFYRSRKTYIEPNTRKRKSTDEYWDRNGRIDESGYRRGVAAARGISQSWRRVSSSDDQANQDMPRRFSRPVETDMADDHGRPRVKFASPESQERAGDRAARRREAMRDWVEEKADQQDFKNIKKQVRHDVKEGAGDFELDGHLSEDYEKQDSYEDLETSYRRIPALSSMSVPEYICTQSKATGSARAPPTNLFGPIHTISEISRQSYAEIIQTRRIIEVVNAPDHCPGTRLSVQAVSSLSSEIGSAASVSSFHASVASVSSFPAPSRSSENEALQDDWNSPNRDESVLSYRHNGHPVSETSSRSPRKRNMAGQAELSELVDDMAKSHISDDRSSRGTAELNRIYEVVPNSHANPISECREGDAKIAQFTRSDLAESELLLENSQRNENRTGLPGNSLADGWRERAAGKEDANCGYSDW